MMPDREKVEMGLTICTSTEPCNGCPYLTERNCSLAMVNDALALLKEQPEIVRCKDCEYAPGNERGFVCKIRDHFGAFMHDPDNFYCASGKNKGT